MRTAEIRGWEVGDPNVNQILLFFRDMDENFALLECLPQVFFTSCCSTINSNLIRTALIIPSHKELPTQWVDKWML